MSEAHGIMTEEFDTAKVDLKATKKALKQITEDYDTAKEELDKVKAELAQLHGELGDFKTT